MDSCLQARTIYFCQGTAKNVEKLHTTNHRERRKVGKGYCLQKMVNERRRTNSALTELYKFGSIKNKHVAVIAKLYCQNLSRERED